MKLDIPYLLQNLTLEEKAGLCSGQDFWHTKAVERLGLPAIMVSDGPHGLRKQDEAADHLGLNDSVKAVCFPTGAALASSFDRDLARKLGEYLGEEARAENVHTLLGPAINIKRSPLCGRNFEYMSEDPYLAGALSASYVNGVQSKGVGVSVKHYAANNQEYNRMSVDTLVDERTLREIYLKAFETTVREAKPWTIMCAYNRLNGTYCCENEWLLTDTLRKEWGFDGIVMTDWGAMNDRPEALRAGLNLEMPASHGLNDRKIVEAVENGTLDMQTVDGSVRELLQWIERGLNERPEVQGYDKQAHNAFSRQMAAQCAVLLKNDGGLLPLQKQARVAFVGPFAEKPRYQGGGSSHINITKLTSAVEAAADAGNLSVTYSPGMEKDGVTASDTLLREAVEAARAADVTVVFAGLPDSYESEGYDREHLDMPPAQNALIEAIAAAQPRCVVVLHNGSPVTMPWLAHVPAVLEMYLGGQAVGGAAVDVLFGDAYPGGRLAETFPLRLEDTPAYLQFPGDGETVRYGEGVFVGYRWYDSRDMEVLFPFGHGLSYTSFAITDVTLSAPRLAQGDGVEVSVKVKNTGARKGAEVVQLYLTPEKATQGWRPAQELKGFEKVELEPGEERTVSFRLTSEAFAYYDTGLGRWYTAPGSYGVRVGTSSRDIAAQATLEVDAPAKPFCLTQATTVGDVLAGGREANISEALAKLQEEMGGAFSDDPAASDEMTSAMIHSMPLHSLPSFTNITAGELAALLARLG